MVRKPNINNSINFFERYFQDIIQRKILIPGLNSSPVKSTTVTILEENMNRINTSSLEKAIGSLHKIFEKTQYSRYSKLIDSLKNEYDHFTFKNRVTTYKQETRSLNATVQKMTFENRQVKKKNKGLKIVIENLTRQIKELRDENELLNQGEFPDQLEDDESSQEGFPLAQPNPDQFEMEMDDYIPLQPTPVSVEYQYPLPHGHICATGVLSAEANGAHAEIMKCMNNGHTANAMNNGHTANAMNNGHTANAMNNGYTANAMNNGHTANAMNNGHTAKAMNNGHTANAMNNGHYVYVMRGEQLNADSNENRVDNGYSNVISHIPQSGFSSDEDSSYFFSHGKRKNYFSNPNPSKVR